jgi:hypothetical protein
MGRLVKTGRMNPASSSSTHDALKVPVLPGQGTWSGHPGGQTSLDLFHVSRSRMKGSQSRQSGPRRRPRRCRHPGRQVGKARSWWQPCSAGLQSAGCRRDRFGEEVVPGPLPTGEAFQGDRYPSPSPQRPWGQTKRLSGTITVCSPNRATRVPECYARSRMRRLRLY